jgi:hypothetical protein
MGAWLIYEVNISSLPIETNNEFLKEKEQKSDVE